MTVPICAKELKDSRKGLKRILGADPEHNETALSLVTSQVNEVTFEQFKAVMEQRNHDVDELTLLFRDKIDNPRRLL